MTSLSFLKFLRFLRKGDKDLFDVPRKEQQAFLGTFPQPKNDIQRSLYQFKCQSFFWPKWKIPFFNLGAFFVFFPVLIVEWFRSAFVKPSHHYDAIGEFKGMEECIPEEINKEYDIRHEGWLVKGLLRTKDLGFALKVFFSSFPNTYFSLKIIMKMAQYCQLIEMYSPRAIIAHCEFSFASSVLTGFCEKQNVKHINVMHGEKLFHIYDSFFRFDKCYVWSDFYRRLFVSLRALPEQFVVSVPLSMKINTDNYLNEKVYADYKYYLADNTEEEIAAAVASMKRVRDLGKTVKFRMHPRYLDVDMMLKYTTINEIEDPREVTILESVSNCEYAVGSYSTVLAQAYMSGKQVILDDITFKEEYERLAEYDYWLASEKCMRLSEV